MEKTKVRVLPADVYDALELSALEFGGIGKGSFGNTMTGMGLSPLRRGEDTPCCVHGHGAFLEGEADRSVVGDALYEAGIGMVINDMAFKPAEKRISFDEWCKRLNVVRGDQ